MLNLNINKLGQKNFNTICRLCLLDGQFLRDINGTKILSMIQCCLDIKILPEDELPTHICARCFRQITNFYTFKRKTERNNRALKESLELRSNPKDIINIALEKSNIIPLEVNGIQTVDTTCFLRKNIVKIINKESEPQESQNTLIDIYHNPVSNSDNQDVNINPNPYLGICQRQQRDSLSFDYNIEPPPLAPLRPNSDRQESISKSNRLKSSVSKNSSKTIYLQPPSLVPIIPAFPANNAVSQFCDKNTTASTKLPCGICREEFESLSALQGHKLKSCKLNTQDCNICKKTFRDKNKLIFHLKRHKITKKLLCNVCGNKYSSPSTFIIHFRSHTGERPFKCNVCGKGFMRWAGVKTHMKTHEDFKPYKCETCAKEFKVISNLYRHQRLHTGDYTISCNFCGKAYYQSDHLKLHIRTYHTNEKPYLCCECGKGFVSFQRLKRHELVHSGQKPHPCALCLRAYSNAIDLKNHNLRVHNTNGNGDDIKKYSCTICGLKFRHPCRLTKHMKTHVDLNKNCQACGHSFRGVQALTKHLKTSSCKNATVKAQPISN